MTTTHRAKRIPGRRAMTAAGLATLAFSLIVSIGPALAAPGDGLNGNGISNGNAGTVKIHDAVTALEAGVVSNEAWVCSFWVGFYSDAAEVGTWQLQSWPPTGDATVVASGTYDTSSDGVDATNPMSFADGHYRLEWAANGSNAKQKTFWVACDAASSDEEAPSDEESPSDPGSNPSDESPDEGPNEQGGNPDPTQQPEGDVKSGNSRDDYGSVDASNSAGGDSAGVPDTSIAPDQVSTGLGGVLAAIGILLIVLAHAGTRRERQLPTA